MTTQTVNLTQPPGAAYKPLVMAALSYLGILCFVPLMRYRDDQYVQFHARQGLVLWMWAVLSLFILEVPVIGKWVFGFSSTLILVLSVAGLASVAFRRAWKLPLVAYIADRI
ncbi:hypothetical protein [Paramagnetospirillum magneticum]|uniref:Magnetosome protein MamF n=1 Tax=Paramagnetospirillum magneticum (strain ATCC 700264 / AMB-1) TaxID=342108 RepID=Q2WAA9_PARM1|nr:hypothetical protein [Paramagnetospirillum magneticum]BAE49216.1 hypothetical protein amb0412 [Paramagnetospirillum magneticum AMB-1]